MGDLPRTSTGGLVDPMKTKLEMMVAYLAGRKGEAADSIRRESRTRRARRAAVWR